MKNIIFSALLVLFLSACAPKSGGGGAGDSAPANDVSSNPKIVSIDPVVDSVFQTYLASAAEAGASPNASNIIIQLDPNLLDFEPGLGRRGKCDKSGPTPTITLLTYDWVGRPGDEILDVNDDYHLGSLFHLLGECLLNKGPDNRTLYTDVMGVIFHMPFSYMNSAWAVSSYPPEFLNSGWRHELQVGLFQ